MLTKLKSEAIGAKRAIEDAVSGKDGMLKQCQTIVNDWRGLPIEEQNRLNAEKLDELVIPWQKLVNSPTELGSRSKYPLIFTHVPKCGGTTLEYLIAKNYTINGVIHINAPALDRNPQTLFKKGEFPHVVMGHHKLNHPLFQLASRKFVHITMLREPVSRVVSYYNYLQTSQNHGLHKKASGMTLEEFVDSNDMVEIHNAQTLRLAGVLKRSLLKKHSKDTSILDVAKHNLTNRFSFYGMTEQYTEFLLIARKLLGWSDIFYQRRNVTKKRENKATADDAIREKILDHNKMDCELFAFAQEVFAQRCNDLSINNERVEQFMKKNEEYCAMVSEQI